MVKDMYNQLKDKGSSMKDVMSQNLWQDRRSLPDEHSLSTGMNSYSYLEIGENKNIMDINVGLLMHVIRL